MVLQQIFTDLLNIDILHCLFSILCIISVHFIDLFQTQNFMGLHWCDFCANFMWGLIAQGVKCLGNVTA